MSSWKIILATVVIFGAGVVTGGLLVGHADRTRLARFERGTNVWRGVPLPSPAGLRVEFLRRVERELNLRPGQKERVDKILKESQERTRREMEPLLPRLREDLQRTRDEFRAALDPEQQARFDELVRQQQKVPPRDVRDPRRPQYPSLDKSGATN